MLGGRERERVLLDVVEGEMASAEPDPATWSPRFGEKEAYMGFMTGFLEEHGPAMQRFLEQVAMVDVGAAPSSYQGTDLALRLAVLHAQLCTIFAELDQVRQSTGRQGVGCQGACDPSG